MIWIIFWCVGAVVSMAILVWTDRNSNLTRREGLEIFFYNAVAWPVVLLMIAWLKLDSRDWWGQPLFKRNRE